MLCARYHSGPWVEKNKMLSPYSTHPTVDSFHGSALDEGLAALADHVDVNVDVNVDVDVDGVDRDPSSTFTSTSTTTSTIRDLEALTTCWYESGAKARKSPARKSNDSSQAFSQLTPQGVNAIKDRK